MQATRLLEFGWQIKRVTRPLTVSECRIYFSSRDMSSSAIESWRTELFSLILRTMPSYVRAERVYGALFQSRVEKVTTGNIAVDGCWRAFRNYRCPITPAWNWRHPRWVKSSASLFGSGCAGLAKPS